MEENTKSRKRDTGKETQSRAKRLRRWKREEKVGEGKRYRRENSIGDRECKRRRTCTTRQPLITDKLTAKCPIKEKKETEIHQGDPVKEKRIAEEKRDTGRLKRRSQSEQNEEISYKKEKSDKVFPKNCQDKNEEQAEAEGLVWQKRETKEGKKKSEEEAMKVKEITKIEVEKVSQKCSKNSFSKQTNQSISKVTRKVTKPKPKIQFSSGKKKRSNATPKKVKDIREYFESLKTETKIEKQPPDKINCGAAQQLKKWGRGNFNPKDRNLDPKSARNSDTASSPAYKEDHLVKNQPEGGGD